MTRARNITVFGGILFAGMTLAGVRADVTSTQSTGQQSSEETGIVTNLDEFFSENDLTAEEAPEENWDIELVNLELVETVAASQAPTPAPVPGQPELNAQPGPGITEHGVYPEGSQPGPNWAPEWSGNPYAEGPAYGPNGCNSCGPNCGPDCQSCCGGPIYIQNGWGDIWNKSVHPFGLVAGAEATFLVPLDEPSQSVTLTDLNTGRRWSGDPRGTLGGGVRTWIGLQRCGWGIRVRYWRFGVDNVDPDPSVPKWAEPTLVENYHLVANVLDLELTQRFFVHCWQIDTSFGARYADLERYIQTVGFGQVGNGVDLYGLAMGSNSLEGTGFTASIRGTRQIHPCSGWHVFWNFRGSALWADTMASVLTDASAFTVNPPGSANARNHANSTADKEDVYIAEAQVGLEYRIRSCCWGQLSFRGGIEYQYWNTGDLYAQSQSFAFLQGGNPPFGGDSTANANAADGDLELIGFILGLEWTY